MIIKITCTEAFAVPVEISGVFTAGMVGAEVEFIFDQAWDNLIKAGWCRCGTENMAFALDASGRGTIPHEILIPGKLLYIGADGWSADGELRIPTVWANCGRVAQSAAGQKYIEPSPDFAMQLLGIAQASDRNSRLAAQIAEDIRKDAAAGKFNGQKGDNGDKGDKGDDYVLTEADKDDIADTIAGDLIVVSAEEPTSPRTAAVVDPETEDIELLDLEDRAQILQAQQEMDLRQDELEQEQQELRKDTDELYDWTAAPVAPDATNPRVDNVLRFNGAKIVLSSGYPGFSVYGYRLEGYTGRKISIDADSGGYLHAWTDNASTISGHIIGEAHDGDRIPDNALRLFVTAYSDKPPTVTVLTNGIAKLAVKQAEIEEAQTTLKEDLVEALDILTSIVLGDNADG